MARLRLACIALLLAAASARDQSRWSRQISSYTADISDWVPLPGPVEREPSPPQIKRQAIAEPRILSEPFPGFSRPTGFSPDSFPSRSFYQSPANRPLYLQSVPSVPSAPQNFLTDQGFGQSIRFGLSQPNFPLSQGFVAPQYNFDTVPQIKPRPGVPSNPVKFESFPKTNLPSPQAKPFINQAPKKKPESPKFVDGYRIENASSDFTFNQKKKPQSLQKLKYDTFDKIPKTETLVPNKSKLEREEVQLLYVPVESLNRGQFNYRSPVSNHQIVNPDLYSQGLPKQNPLKQTFLNDFQRPAKPVENISFGQDYYNFNSQVNNFDQTPKFSTISTPFPTAAPTTPRPKKLKPHQPPLAVFLSQEARKGSQVKVGDVLSSLKNANTIAVLDTVNPESAPKVFIGPSTLTPPENFVKFELPYLSNIENSDKKLKQLPFFVAPLSYHTPDGFAKIPFPSPHVGSVVINSQIKETASATLTTPIADVIPNSYIASPPSYKQEKPVTQKPNFSYYSTIPPKTNSPNYQSEYYSFEPQSVTSIRPPKEQADSIITAPPKPGSYFLSNADQYNPSQFVNFPSENAYNSQEQVKPQVKQEAPSTTRAPAKTTSKPTSTYASQLLETHNPYSINQAFHFSTPLDYNNFFDEYKENQGTQEFKPSLSSSASPTPVSSTYSTSPKPVEAVTEKQTYQQQSSPNYLQSYTPEIHYESDRQSSRYPVFNNNEYSTNTDYSRPPSSVTNNLATISSASPQTENRYVETQSPVSPAHENVNEGINEIPTTASGPNIQSTRTPYHYNQEDIYSSNESKEPSTTSTTTPSTTTRPTRPTIRSRGRPRYTTPKPDSNESNTKSTVTRKPLRERRPLPNRPRYEPNKITTERATRKPADSNESTTKASSYSGRTRTRGRVQFKPTEGDESQYHKSGKGQGGQKEDLAYQRDVLHQNYPVTLMERTSTVDVEAITEPSKFTSNRNVETSSADYDTENAYTYEKASVSQFDSKPTSKENIYSTRSEVRTETPYVPHVPSSREEQYTYHSRSSLAPVDAISSYDETSPENEDSYAKQTTPIQRNASPEVYSYATEPASPVTEQNVPSYTVNIRKEESSASTGQANEDTKFLSQEVSHEAEEEKTVQTTPSYNRVRVRPGVIRQYHQASSTESSKIKSERKRPVQAITYRPAFDRRRTTMRIEEIEADLKTKQVHTRPEVAQDYRHPVYKPDPTTEAPVTTSSQESTTKRSHFRRKRPNYTTSTESSSTKKNTYEVKNRFRGRRPTEKPTEKPEVQTDTSSTTTRNTLHSRYSSRPRLSERYNKKPETTESEDQEPNYSINRPKYAEPEADHWSPKISTDTFKPYNPNDIIEDRKDITTGRGSTGEGELDIITARNEYEDILISVTPATNNRGTKKIPDIPPTLEALVEQSKVTKSDSTDNMSTFESMLEEVMKSLEEQDEDEYSSNVMKHKGGEIGEIPPERIISSGDNYSKATSQPETEETTPGPSGDDSSVLDDEDKDRKGRRRGFWKKVKVRPATTESIEAAESQYYSHTVNRLGDSIKPNKNLHDKSEKPEKSQKVTTYKPSFSIQDIFASEDIDVLPTIDIPKLDAKATEIEEEKSETEEPKPTTENFLEKETPTEKSLSPGDFDLGTGSPDPTIADVYTTTEPTSSEQTLVDRSDGFSLMDYLFGVTASDNEQPAKKDAAEEKPTTFNVELETEPTQKSATTESSIIPEEITEIVDSEENVEALTEFSEIKKVNGTAEVGTEKSVETSSVSSFMDPANVVSTSMSTEVSHETEICFRGKCIKTSKDIL